MKTKVDMHAYLFDVKIFASVRVTAPDEDTARGLIEAINADTAMLGSWPNGDPVVCEITVFENAAGGSLRPVEVDGQSV